MAFSRRYWLIILAIFVGTAALSFVVVVAEVWWVGNPNQPVNPDITNGGWLSYPFTFTIQGGQTDYTCRTPSPTEQTVCTEMGAR